MTQPLATVPYAPGKSFDFYNDVVTFLKYEIAYDDIDGYSFGLLDKSYSVSYIPVGNSRSININFLVGRRAVSFTKSASSPMLFKGDRHDTIQLIFSELVKCIETFVAPYVFEKLCLQLDEGASIKIGGLTLTNDSIIKKVPFGKKEMEEYGYTSIEQGYVKIHYPNGEVYDSISLSVMNAPMVPYILDKYFRDES